MKLDIVVASDENYAIHMSVLIESICDNNLNHEVAMHILDNHISIRTKESLAMLCKRYPNLKLLYYPMDENLIINKLGGKVIKDRSISTYARIFIPELLNHEIKRAVYFDVDAICLGDISELFTMNMEEHCIAGVMDCNFPHTKNAVGLENDGIYINAGMIVWNLEKCRATNVVQRLIDFVAAHNGNVVAMDQGTINGVLSKEIMLLHPRWNCLTPFFQMTRKEICRFYQIENYYDNYQLKEATDMPKFVHFVPNFITRPWVENCRHPFADEYWKYRRMLSSFDEILQPDNRDFKAKIAERMFYHLPFPIFIILFEWLRK